MRTLIYKRTHNGDPDPETGEFGIYGCMGRVRAWNFDAVIGVGGLTAKPQSLVGKVNWVGIGPTRGRRRGEARVLTFEHFVFYDSERPTAPDLETLAPRLAERLYSQKARVVMKGLSVEEQKEVAKILARARRDALSRSKSHGSKVAANYSKAGQSRFGCRI